MRKQTNKEPKRKQAGDSVKLSKLLAFVCTLPLYVLLMPHTYLLPFKRVFLHGESMKL